MCSVSACFSDVLEFRVELAASLVLLAFRGGFVSSFLHGAEDVLVVGVQVMVETQEVKLRVPGLLRLQHDLKLGPLLAHKVSSALDDGVGLNGRGLEEITSEQPRVETQFSKEYTHSITNIDQNLICV